MTEKFSVIYADPPWPYNARRNKGTLFGTGAYGKYPLMKWADVYALNVKDFAADRSALFLWVVWPFLDKCIPVFKHWGFEYVTVGFVWVKTNKNDTTPFFGVGHYTKSNTEVCLLGMRGRPRLEVRSNNVSQLVVHPRMKHSRKPPVVRDRIEELFGDVPRLELFAREQADGWWAWGNELSQ